MANKLKKDIHRSGDLSIWISLKSSAVHAHLHLSFYNKLVTGKTLRTNDEFKILLFFIDIRVLPGRAKKFVSIFSNIDQVCEHQSAFPS